MLEIGSIYNVHETTIRKYLIDKNIKLRNQGFSVFTGSVIQDVIKLYEEGKSTPYIAKLYKCVVPTVLRLLKRNNIKIRKRTTYRTSQTQ